MISADSAEIFKLCERHTASPFRWIFDIFSIGKNYFCFGKPLFGQVNNIKTYLTLFYGIIKNTFFIS